MTEEFIDILKSVNPMVMEGDGLSLVADNIIDSLDVINIVVKMEEKYNIKFESDDISVENFASVKSIWDLIQRLKGA